jgi:hypothetical protein
MSMRELEFKAALLRFEIEFEGMKIANLERSSKGQALAYNEQTFDNLETRLQNYLGDIRMMKD